MHTRFEEDLAEIADGGQVLVICAGRKKVFLEGAEVVQCPLDDVAGIAHDETGLLVRLADGTAHPCALPSATEAEREALAGRLDDCVRAWR